jgi:hypothetical protein
MVVKVGLLVVFEPLESVLGSEFRNSKLPSSAADVGENSDDSDVQNWQTTAYIVLGWNGTVDGAMAMDPMSGAIILSPANPGQYSTVTRTNVLSVQLRQSLPIVLGSKSTDFVVETEVLSSRRLK